MPERVTITDEELRAALPFRAIADRALDLVRTAHAAAEGRGFAGLPTGLPSLDTALGGLQAGLHILAAEPGAGKTALGLHISRAVASQCGPVIYTSFDEMPERLALKVLAARSGLCMSDMTAGRIAPEKVADALATHGDGLERLSFMPADVKLTPQDLVEQMTDRLKHHGARAGLVVVDYLQPWAAVLAGILHTEFRMAVGQLALQLREVSLKTGCPVLLISAQNRSGQGTASMTSLRESSDLEYGADSIMLLTRNDEAMVGMGKRGVTLTLAKNRFGPSGEQLPLVLDVRSHVFTDANPPSGGRR